ncbi:MAG TPA: formate dehydrogenase N subunit beta transmembrane domain-containing protein, partial [Burkholderiaceae bacterium]|nr:formate dehydrogenase N subunit beta transmembrane domain-containing protein [Burkholderiaceae bacterium]
ISPLVTLWKGISKPLALFAMIGAVVASFFHYNKVGPVEPPGEGDPGDPDRAEAPSGQSRRDKDAVHPTV